MVGIVFFSSCARQDEAHPNTNTSKSGTLIVPRTVSSVADRLYFAEYEDFEDYYTELDSLLSYDTDMFDSIVLADSPVETINDLYTTTSIETFLADPVMRAIVNANYEFQIDSVLVTFINNDQILTADAYNSSLRTSIRAIPKGEHLSKGDIPSDVFWGNPDDIENAIKIGCGCSINIRAFTDCANVRVWGACHGFWGHDGDGLVTVDFDPNGLAEPVERLNEEISGNFEFFINVTSLALYQQEGIFDATVDPECQLAAPKYAAYSYDPATFASCDNEHRTARDTITNGNERMRIETSYYRGTSGYTHKAEIISETLSNSKWERTKANLEVEVDANRQSQGCTFLDSKSDDASCNNCKSKITRVRWSSECSHCDGDLIGTFQKIKSNITLQSTQSVDFICCE